ncbi:pyridoxal-phosphate dependent enzyme [Streptomyces libani]
MTETLTSLPAPAWFAHPGARTWTCPPAPSEVHGFHASLPGYAPTPLTELPSLAAELKVGRVFVKDESCRLGLPAFKALGASWAVHRTLAERADLAERSGLADRAGSQEAGGPVTLVTATDGNHGRAVARMARLLGQRAHVFVPEGVHPAATAAIAAEEARVTEVAGNYDEAVRQAADAVAATPAAVLIQDTAWPGYERIPGWIVEGYATLFAEIDTQLAVVDAGLPDLVAVPVGVGSLAQAARHPLPKPPRRCGGPAVGRARQRSRRPGEPHPAGAGHRDDRRDHHDRLELRYPLDPRLALPP